MSTLPHFYYHPRMLAYDFGPQHPLKPERLRRAIAILESYGVEPIDPGEGSVADVVRVHAPEYVDAVKTLSEAPAADQTYGFGPGDNPPFEGMFQASLAYTSGSARAAEAVRDGAPLAFGIAGGLHHAHRDRASGFCIFNDPAVAVDILRERFERVAYVDIDVHHGDGVQWLFYDDPAVLTCSIHEDPRTLFPGTGFVDEVGVGTSLNVPMEAGTTGDTWLWAFRETVIPAIQAFKPQAIVLQMGTDAHYLDPLAHIRCTAQEWLEAVREIKDEDIPIVAVGGGGYEITCVPRMWTAACLTLGRVAFDDRLPDFAEQWGMTTYSDAQLPQPRESGRDHAQKVVAWIRQKVLPGLDRSTM
jgi:acetoin utilization protein AcuC